ncbi:choice-of-anchor Q domain-containing protein [Syntrophus buswellii]|jgi:hypothetical protein|uniref:choice-of-anchor Q domain-containing protein n=1 Tax=Syntrophus buswellii TaxID=43774 RepID=UPI0038D40C7C
MCISDGYFRKTKKGFIGELLFVLLWLVVSLYGGIEKASAATYYVTQNGSGSRNGLKYEDSMSVSNHNSGTWTKDDVFYLCDVITSTISPPTSGETGHPIIYRGDYPGHPGTVDGGGLLTYGLYPKVGVNYLVIDSLEIKNCLTVGVLLRATSSASTEALQVTINNCNIHDILAGNGIDGRGVGLTVTNSTIYNIWYDGIYHVGANTTISGCYIHDVDQTTGTPGGDCIQLGDMVGGWIHRNILDHSSKATKHCFIGTNTAKIIGKPLIFERNICTQGVAVEGINSRIISAEDITNGQIVRYNKLYGGKHSITPLGNAHIYSNIMSGASDYAISVQSNSPAGTIIDIYNNTMHKSHGGITFPTNNYIIDIKNNIMHTVTKAIYQTGVSATINLDINYNIFFNTESIYVYNYCTGGENNVIADPLFISSSDYRIQSTSPAINAGIDVGLMSDYVGSPIIGLPDIGAYEYQSSTSYHPSVPCGLKVLAHENI